MRALCIKDVGERLFFPVSTGRMSVTNPVQILRALLRCPSVTPEEAGALGVLEDFLKPLGFSVERPVFSAEGTPDVENLYARLGSDEPHVMFAGHTDVVPPGNAQDWTHPPFDAEIDGDDAARGRPGRGRCGPIGRILRSGSIQLER